MSALHLLRWPTNLPVVTERVHDAAENPAVLVGDGNDLPGARCDRLIASCSRIGDDQEHADGAAADRLGAEVEVRLGLFGDPELGAVDGEPADSTAGNLIHLTSIKGRGVKRHGTRPIADMKRGGDLGLQRCEHEAMVVKALGWPHAPAQLEDKDREESPRQKQPWSWLPKPMALVGPGRFVWRVE